MPGLLTVYEGVLLFDVLSYTSKPTSNLYVGRKRMGASWNPLKTEPVEEITEIKPC